MTEKIAVFGADSQVGSTMTAVSMARLLTERGKQVLLVLCSGKYGDDFIQNKGAHSIDDVRASLANGHLDRCDLEQAMIHEKGLAVLPGVRDIHAAAYYPENALSTLAECAGDYHFLIFDCGERVDLGLPFSGIRASDRKYLVMTQQEKSIRRGRYMMEHVYRPLGAEPKLIINKFIRTAARLPVLCPILTMAGKWRSAGNRFWDPTDTEKLRNS